MKTKIFSALMVVCMLMTMVATVFAAGTAVTDEATLNTALAAGGTVTLGSDIDLTNGLEVPAGVTVTLDLNGYTLSLKRDGTLSAYDQTINNKGNLTVVDSSSAKTGAVTYQYVGSTVSQGFAANAITNNPGATLTIQGGTIENKTTTSHTCYAIDSLTNGSVGGKDTTLNIEGGTIKSIKGEGRGLAVRACLNSTEYSNVVNISGGTLIGGYGGLQVHNISSKASKADVTIDDGEFVGTYAFYTYLSGTDGSKVNITINDGDFSGYVFLYNHNTGSDGEKGFSATVKDGTFTDGGIYLYNTDASGNEASIQGITGGIYDAEPDAVYIADGYVALPYEGDMFIVAKPVNVSYEAGEGTGVMEGEVIPAGNFTLPECGFTAPEGKAFKAWSVNGTEVAENGVVELTQDTVITALWDEIAVEEEEEEEEETNKEEEDNDENEEEIVVVTPAPTAPPSAPVTGDNSNIGLWFLMMIVSGTVCALVFHKRKSRA